MRICVFYSVLVVLHFKIYHIVAFKDLSTGHTFSLKFFKRKKEKKESTLVKWRVSKKQVFFKKYYHPNSSFGSQNLLLCRKVVLKTYGWWRFFKKPAGLELAFLQTRNLPLLSFFYFIFLLSEQDFPLGVGFFCFGVEVFLQGFQILGLEKKQKVNYKRFCPEPKFETLAALFDFLWCLKGKYTVAVSVNSILLLKNAKHLKKTM